MDGHARILCAAVDIGAYEAGIGDADCNNVIDLFDAASFQACFDPVAPVTPFVLPSECVPFDFDANGQIDLSDYAAFADILAGPD